MHVKISHVIRPIEMLENRETQVGKIYDGETFKVSGNWDSIIFFTGNRESMIFVGGNRGSMIFVTGNRGSMIFLTGNRGFSPRWVSGNRGCLRKASG